jgi:hypothetical protein
MLELERGRARSYFVENTLEGTINYRNINYKNNYRNTNYVTLIQMCTYSFHITWVLFTETWRILELQAEIGCRYIS